MKVKINIDTRTFVRFWLVVISFIIALFAIYEARGALILVGIAAFLALALNPPVSKLAKHLPGKSRAGATALAYVLVVIFLIGFAVLVVPPIIDHSVKFAQTLPQKVDDLTQKASVINHFVEHYGLQDQYNQAINDFQQNVRDYVSHFSTALISSFSAIISVMVSTLVVLVMAFLMLVEGPIWRRRLWNIYRDDERLNRHKVLADKMYKVVTGYVNGQVLVAAIAAVTSLVAILILSALFELPANLALPIAAIIFLTGMIPMFGATVGAIIAAILLGINDLWAAGIFIVYFFIYQQIENNFISPTVQSKTVEISALTVLVALTIGIWMFGIIGGLISIPIAGCLKILLIDYLERNKRARLHSKTSGKKEAKADAK